MPPSKCCCDTQSPKSTPPHCASCFGNTEPWYSAMKRVRGWQPDTEGVALKDRHSADEILAAHLLLLQQRRHTWLSLSLQAAFSDLEGSEAAIGALSDEELGSTVVSVLGNQAMAVPLKRGQFAQVLDAYDALRLPDEVSRVLTVRACTDSRPPRLDKGRASTAS